MEWVALVVALVGLVISAKAAFNARRSADSSERSADAAEIAARASESTSQTARESLAFQMSESQRIVNEARKDFLRTVATEVGSTWGNGHRIMPKYEDIVSDEEEEWIFDVAGKIAGAKPRDRAEMLKKWREHKTSTQ